MRYTLGFLFARDRHGAMWVLLTRKENPPWMNGRWNGIGGKIKENESYREAMIRESWEEIGDWDLFCTMDYSTNGVYVFKAFVGEIGTQVPTFNDVGERMEWYQVEWLPEGVLPNLRWLIPLALDEENKLTVMVGKEILSCR